MSREAKVTARWAASLLHRLGIPARPQALRALEGWARAEGGHFHNTARFNILNTTLPMRGAGNTGAQGNIKVYRDWRQGVEATARTLENGRYGGILHALRHGSAEDVGRAVVGSPWGTNGLVLQTIAGQRALVPRRPLVGGGGAGGGGAGGGGAVAGGGRFQLGSLADELGPLAGPDLRALLPQRMGPPVSAPPAPAFSARASLPMPGGASPLVPMESGAPAPKVDVLAALGQGGNGAAGLSPLLGRGGAAGGGGGGAGVAPTGGRPLPHTRRTLGEMFRIAQDVDRLNNKGRVPYAWGGGHGATPAKVGTPVDCSGFVSQILGIAPRVSGDFATSWGHPGKGKWVTVYANSHHVLIAMRDPRTRRVRWFATSRSNPGGGAGEIARPSRSYLAQFTTRHPGRR